MTISSFTTSYFFVICVQHSQPRKSIDASPVPLSKYLVIVAKYQISVYISSRGWGLYPVCR
jgi:hypothetical protein